MCLSNPKRIKTLEPITVYKLFGVLDSGELASPCQYGHYWKTGERKNAGLTEFQKRMGDYINWMDHFSYRKYEDDDTRTSEDYFTFVQKEAKGFHGAYHSFKTYDEALKWAKDNNFFLYFNKLAIGKCTIPDDSEYTYEGVMCLHGNTYGSYASASLILDEIVYEEQYSLIRP